MFYIYSFAAPSIWPSLGSLTPSCCLVFSCENDALKRGFTGDQIGSRRLSTYLSTIQFLRKYLVAALFTLRQQATKTIQQFAFNVLKVSYHG